MISSPRPAADALSGVPEAGRRARGILPFFRRVALLVLPPLLAGLSPGCSSPPPAAKRQIETLRAIADLERDVSAFAASRAGVRAADAHVREGRAIVILTPAESGAIDASVVEEIDAYVRERAGLGKDRIVIKARAPAGGNHR